ncbi:transglutaminase-like domain-containing protein [Streptomyces polygonati]|uniref:Transglutaminase-like domain-containing protein n=1 Tax=Streptomyces polygonati TaxID=1617087 RepID=A0ABV8HLW7_9ACTN
MTAVRLAPDAAAYYSSQSVVSEPGEMAGWYGGLPHGVGELARVVRDVVIHRLEGEQFGAAIPADRMRDDAETRYVDDILRLIVARDDAPLTVRRAYGDRFVGTCRDFTLLHVSMLRHAGVPARLRSGFADYFGTDGFHFDHVVTEYWDDARGWLLADAQLADPAITARFPVDFDPMDVPRDRFLVAGSAWQTIRSGAADPKTFGVQPEGPLVGEWFVAGSVRLDLAALNKTETLLWDIWGAGASSDDDMTDDIRTLYDRTATITAAPDVPYEAARTLFTTTATLRTPRTVLSLAPFNGPRQVTLR